MYIIVRICYATSVEALSLSCGGKILLFFCLLGNLFTVFLRCVHLFIEVPDLFECQLPNLPLVSAVPCEMSFFVAATTFNRQPLLLPISVHIHCIWICRFTGLGGCCLLRRESWCGFPTPVVPGVRLSWIRVSIIRFSAWKVSKIIVLDKAL